MNCRDLPVLVHKQRTRNFRAALKFLVYSNIEAILAVMNTTELLVKIRPEKIQVSYRYRRGHGFKSNTGLNFLQALFSLLVQ